MNILKSLKNKIAKESAKEERLRIAKMIANAGHNQISLNNGSDFTGTYWISANNLYFYLTGKHLNHAFEDGDIPRNEFMDEISNSN